MNTQILTLCKDSEHKINIIYFQRLHWINYLVLKHGVTNVSVSSVAAELWSDCGTNSYHTQTSSNEIIYLKLLIFTRSSSIPCIFFSCRGIPGHLFKRKKFYPFVCGFRDMNF